jgi:capsular polysaccharide biosynthesis protein
LSSPLVIRIGDDRVVVAEEMSMRVNGVVIEASSGNLVSSQPRFEAPDAWVCSDQDMQTLPAPIQHQATRVHFPGLAHLNGRLMGRDLLSEAVVTWELSPAETVLSPAAWYDTAEFERVNGLAAGGPLEGEWRKLLGGSIKHGATLAHELHNVVVCDGDLYGAASSIVRGQRRPAWIAKTEREIDHAVLVSGLCRASSATQWVVDDLPRMLIGQDLELPALVIDEVLSPSQQLFLDQLRLAPLRAASTRIRRLLLVQDDAANGYRRERYARLQSLVRASVPKRSVRGLLMTPGRFQGLPRLENEVELLEMARQLGFRVFDHDAMDFGELAASAAYAQVLITTDGPHVAQALMWMPRGSVLVIIQAPQQLSLGVKTHCDAMGVTMALHVAHQTGPWSMRAELQQVRHWVDRALVESNTSSKSLDAASGQETASGLVSGTRLQTA